MNISTDYPPNYAQISLYFPNHEVHRPVFCYKETIFNPFKVDLTPDIIFHESVHARQQGKDPEGWYEKYYTDPGFRLREETEAYGAQYQFFAKYCKDRELVNHYLQDVARGLSSPLYGSLVSFAQARYRLREYAKKN